MRKRIYSIVLVLVMLLSLMPTTAFAADTGYLQLLNSDGTPAPSDAYTNRVNGSFRIKGSGSYILEMDADTVTSQGVMIESTGDLELTLRNVNIDRSAESAGTGPVAFAIAEYAGNVTIILEGNNSLKGGDGYLGLAKRTDSAKSLSITGTGSLTAVGGSGQAGIGGGSNIMIIVTEGHYAAVQRDGRTSVLLVDTDISNYTDHELAISFGTITEHTVSFDVQGHGIAPADAKSDKNGKITKPTDPSADGWVFDG